MTIKTAGTLTVTDFAECPVWEFDGQEVGTEYVVQPVKSYPITHMNDRVVGTWVTLANGQKGFCVISSIGELSHEGALENATFSFLVDGQRTPVYPFGHPLSQTFGPVALAEKLHLSPEKVFPFSFDLRGVLGVDQPLLAGQWSPDAPFGEDELWERAMKVVTGSLRK